MVAWPRRGWLAVYEAPGTPFALREYPLRPVRPGEVLVRVSMCTICGSDVHSYRGRRPNPIPGLLGHEIIGVVEEIGGDGSRDLRGDALESGDRVTWTEYFGVAPSWERDIFDMPQKSPGLAKYGHERADVDPYFTGGLAD
jgi:NADPH:quinone reductase-like Zn-dependent oxidoreductase